MIVGRSNFESVVRDLSNHRTLSLDTETTGLRPYHGDRLFSIILGTHEEGFYFNFKAYADLGPEFILTPAHMQLLQERLFDNHRTTWVMTNAKYDMAILANEKLELKGPIHCTVAIGRVEYNEYFEYGLDASLKRMGLAKDDTVEKYIAEHHLYEKVAVEGKKTEITNKFFDRVPFDIIAPYGCADAVGTFIVGDFQCRSLESQIAELPRELPSLQQVVDNERRLTKTVFRMEQVGVRIDREYTLRASRFESDRAEKALQGYKGATGRDLVQSHEHFATTFASEKEKFVYGKPTKTGQVNPSFDSDVLASFENPAAKRVLEYRDAKSRMDFYAGFLYHMDRDGRVHPNFNPAGANHGRFSSSNPNFQNLSRNVKEEEFPVRRAIIPTPGYVLFFPDYDQMEYRFFFEQVCRLVGYEIAIAKEINAGFEPHQATANLVTALGTELSRDTAKNGNFAFLFGSGDATLAMTIGGTVDQARALRSSILRVAPELGMFTAQVRNAGRVPRTGTGKRFVFNWFGRRCHLTNTDWAYALVNYLVSGGCADINKIALNKIDDFLIDKKSRLIMSVHDQNIAEVHESEISTVPVEMHRLMETAYASQYLPLTCSAEWSDVSYVDKRKGFPT